MAVFSSCVRVNTQNQGAENIFVITGPPDLRSGPLSQEASKSEAWRGLSPGWGQVLRAPRTVENSIPTFWSAGLSAWSTPAKPVRVRLWHAPQRWDQLPKPGPQQVTRDGPRPAPARAGRLGQAHQAPLVSRLFSRSPVSSSGRRTRPPEEPA